MELRFDRFYRHAELTALLAGFAARNPRLFRVETIGRSHEARDIQVVVASNTATFAAEAASSAGCFAPANDAWEAARFFFRCSCLLTSVALAGKIAGKARKRPPVAGPQRWAINRRVIIPRNKNRMAYSCHFVLCSRASRCGDHLPIPASRPKATAG